MGETTVLSGATSNSKSLRATVPMGIVKQLGLKEGDQLNWQLKIDGDRFAVLVTPLKKDDKK